MIAWMAASQRFGPLRLMLALGLISSLFQYELPERASLNIFSITCVHIMIGEGNTIANAYPSAFKHLSIASSCLRCRSSLIKRSLTARSVASIRRAFSWAASSIRKLVAAALVNALAVYVEAVNRMLIS